METAVDTASVLVLLSQQPQRGGCSGARTSGLATRRHVFACKTCERRFLTFQALGEHRARHRCPKTYNAAGTPEAHEHDEGECAAAAAAGGCPVCRLKSKRWVTTCGGTV